MKDGKIIKSGDKSIAQQIEDNGIQKFLNKVKMTIQDIYNQSKNNFLFNESKDFQF